MTSKNNHKISISLAKINDKDALMKLAQQAHNESVFADMPFSAVKFSAFYDKIINKKAICLVARINDEIVGFIYATLGSYFIADSRPIATVSVIYIKKQIRDTLAGGKVAMRLVKSAKKFAKDHGVSHLLFHVTSGISIANTDRFFRKIGAKTLGGNYAFKL